MQERGERPSTYLPRTSGDPARGEFSLESCIEGGGDVVVLHFTGRLDFVSSVTVKDGVRERLGQQRRNLVLNLEGVDFLNSSGLGALISILKDVRLASGRLVLCSLAPYVKEIFDITQLSDVFEIYTDQKSAVGSFAGQCTPAASGA